MASQNDIIVTIWIQEGNFEIEIFKPIWQNRPLGPRGAGNKAGGRGWKWLEEGESADNQVTAPNTNAITTSVKANIHVATR